jgi:hypothetical protein
LVRYAEKQTLHISIVIAFLLSFFSRFSISDLIFASSASKFPITCFSILSRCSLIILRSSCISLWIFRRWSVICLRFS